MSCGRTCSGRRRGRPFDVARAPRSLELIRQTGEPSACPPIAGSRRRPTHDDAGQSWSARPCRTTGCVWSAPRRRPTERMTSASPLACRRSIANERAARAARWQFRPATTCGARNSSMAADDRSWLLCDPVSPIRRVGDQRPTSRRHGTAFQNVDPGRSIAVIGDVRRDDRVSLSSQSLGDGAGPAARFPHRPAQAHMPQQSIRHPVRRRVEVVRVPEVTGIVNGAVFGHILGDLVPVRSA